MTPSITFGRAGLSVASGGDGMTLTMDPDQLDWDGDTLKIQGDFHTSTLADAVAMRDQLLGYDLNTDEPIIPFTWTGDSSINGFYRVQSVTAGTVGQGSYTAFWFEWEVELLRVPGWQNPLPEVVCSGADRVTAHVITEYEWAGFPSAATSHYFPSGNTPSGDVARTSASGAVNVMYDGAFMYDDAFVYMVTPTDFYDGTCSILTGSTRAASSSAPDITGHRTIVGGQVANVPTKWLLTNGLVSVLPGPSSGEYLVGRYASGAWAYTSFKIVRNGSTATAQGDPDSVVVLRNSVECCAVRLGIANSNQYLDLTVKRGAGWVEGFNWTSSAASLGVFRFSNEAGTGVTGGLNATSDNANADKYQLRSPSAVSTETTKGGIYLTSPATTFPFAVGTDFFTGPTLTEGYFAVMNHRQTIAAR